MDSKNPIFPQSGNQSWGTLTTANTAKDGTGTVVAVFEAPAELTVANSAATYAAGYLTVTCAAHGKPIGSQHDIILTGMACSGTGSVNPSAVATFTATIISATQYVIPVTGDPVTISGFGDTTFPALEARCDTIKCRPLGTNTASVLRLFLNNGLTNATAANNSLYLEVSLPAVTLSEVAAQDDLETAINLVLQPGYKINAVIGTTVAAGWQVTGVGGNYK